MKKLGILALSLCILLFLSGCSVYRLEDAQATQKPLGQKNQVIVLLREGQAEFFESAAQKYAEQNPNVTITVERLPDDASFSTSVLRRIRSDKPPTAFSINGERELQFWQGSLLPTYQLSWINSQKILLGPVTSGEVPYGVPLDLEGYGVVYNLEILDSLEIDHSQIGTLEGLAGIVSQLQGFLPEVALETPVCGNADLADWMVSHSLEEGKPDQLSVCQEIRNLLGFLGVPGDSATQLADRNAAIYLGSTDIFPAVEERNHQRSQDLRIAPFQDGTGKMLVSCDYLAIYKEADPAQQEALSGFLEWLYTSEEGEKLLKSQGVLSPYSDTSASPIQASLYSLQREDKLTVTMAGYEPAGWEQESFLPQLGQVAEKKLSIDDFIQEIQSQWGKRAKSS